VLRVTRRAAGRRREPRSGTASLNSHLSTLNLLRTLSQLSTLNCPHCIMDLAPGASLNPLPLPLHRPLGLVHVAGHALADGIDVPAGELCQVLGLGLAGLGLAGEVFLGGIASRFALPRVP